MEAGKAAGKVWLVTGGGSGLGEACGRLFAKSGALVALLDRDAEAGKAVAQSIKSSKGSAIFIETDVTSEASVKAAIAEAQRTFERPVYGAINCAGVGFAQRTASSSGPHSLEAFNKVMEINVAGTFNVCRLVAHAIISATPPSTSQSKKSTSTAGDAGVEERGVLINTASVAAYEGQIGQVAYAASKGAVVSMTLVMARDLARHGIRVATIAPGTFDTPMLSRLPDEHRRKLFDNTPFPRRLGEPKEFALLALHIAENGFINGETIRLDGALRMTAL